MFYLIARRMDAEPGCKYLVAPFQAAEMAVAGEIQEASSGSEVYVAIASDVSEVYGEYAHHEEVSFDEMKAQLIEWGLEV